MSEQPKPACGPGSFLWHELATRDVAKAKDFYTKLVGWTYDEMDMGPAGKYNIVKSGEKMAGGMMGMQGEVWGDLPSHWGYYIDVADVDATARKVPELGGKVMHGPSDIPDIGRFCVVQDPSGAHVYMMTPTEHAKEPPSPEVGEFLWVELMSHNFAKAKDFFTKLLGWEAQEMPMPNGAYTLFVKDGANVGGGMQMPPEVPKETPGFWMGYIHVADIDATAKQAEAEGGHVMFPPMEVPNVGRFTHIQDPTGAVVAFMTPAPMPGN